MVGWRVCVAAAFLALAGCAALAQPVDETFANNPVTNGRFVQLTNGTESSFLFDPILESLTAVLDVDASPAYYLSDPFTELTEANNASFSVRFRVAGADDQQQPAVFLGLLTDQHVGDFGDGLVMVISLVNGTPVANADIESFDQSYSGSGIGLSYQTEYLAVGRYRASNREFALEIFNGTGFTNLLGFSTVSLPAGRSVTVNRIGMQNAGAREIDSTVGSITLEVTDLSTPANNPRRISINDTSVTEGDIGTTNAVFQLLLSPASSLPITVDFSTADGTALSGQDYLAQSGTVTFPPGITSATISIPVVGDLIPEPTETFSVILTNAVDATLAKGVGVGTIFDNDPLPLLSISDASGLEGNTGTTNLPFLVTLSLSSGETVTVKYATVDGTATHGLDYVATNGTLTFLPGQTTNVVFVPVIGDTNVESDETFTVVLSNPSNAALLNAQGVGTIFDDDSVPRLSINDVTLSEGNSGTTPFVFTVALTRPSNVPITVQYGVAGGTATVGSDFLAASGTLTFPPGVTTTNLTVFVLGDTVPELDETFFVNLSNPSQASIAKGTGLGTIRNDDPFPQLSMGDVSLLEGNSGTTLAVFPVSLSFAIGQTVTVSYATADGTAVASTDYLSQSGTLTFAPGTTNQTISIPVVGNTLNEPDEAFFVDLSQPTFATLGRGRGVGTILNDDPPPVIAVADIALMEGNSGTTNATFSLSLSAASGQLVSVSYATLDGTAKAGSDYVAAFGTVTFPPGTTSQPVTVLVNGDTVFEPDETFLLQLSNPVHASLGNAQATCTIRNDDPPPQMSINDVAVTEAAGGTVAQFTVVLSKPSTQAPVTVSYSTSDGSAIAGRDYVATSGSLTFAPGETQATVSVNVLDDGIHEGGEIFFVNLSSPSNAGLAKAQGQGTIHDNDPLPSLSIHNAQVLEGDSGTTPLVFTVTLSAPSGLPVTASFATSDGTATAGSGDYQTASGQIRFDPGVTNATITVLVNGDLLPEPDETLVVDLSQSLNATLANGRGVGTILDDDTRKITISDTSVLEGPAGTTTNAVFLVSLNKPSTDVVTVTYATSDGTATANSDYYPTNGLISFAPGATSASITIVVIGDNIYEPDETFFVNLTNSSNAVLARAQGVGTIVNDDSALVISPAGMMVVTEDCAPPNGAIDPGETVTVSLGLANTGNLPSANVVATLLPGPGVTPLNTAQTYGLLLPSSPAIARTFSFRADGECGQSLQAVLQVQNGGTNYGNVVFPFMLGTNVAGQPVCCNSADLAVTATADQKTVTINHLLTYSLQVTNRGPKTASDVRLTNFWGAPVTFVSATSSQGNCTNSGQSVLCDLGPLPPGASASVQIVIAPQQAGTVVGFFTARSLENDADLSDNTATVATLVTGPPGLSINNVQVKEGDSGTTNAVFTVLLVPATGRQVTVDFATTDGSALAGQDYRATQGTLTFRPGTTSATISVPVIGDTLIEPDKTFYVNLSNPVNASLAIEQTIGTGIIIDDDFPTLTVQDVTVSEPAAGAPAYALFAFQLSAAPQKPAAVEFFTSDGTAHAPGDYTAASGEVSFAPGMTSTNVAIAVLADRFIEPTETFFLNFTNASAVNLGQTRAQATILDNNPVSLPQVSISGTSVVEGPAHTTTNAVFQLTLSQTSNQAIEIPFTTVNGSATGGSDFVITSGAVRFEPNQTNTLITVLVYGDDIPELDENFFVKLSPPTNATLRVSQAQGIIVNDDYLPEIVSAGTQLLFENCQPPNQAIDPLETVTVNFSLSNHGLGPTTNLVASIRATDRVLPLSNPQTYGVLAANGPSAARPFTFRINDACGQKDTVELELRDGSYVVGTIPFDFTLGLLTNGQLSCCSSADLGVTVSSGPDTAPQLAPLNYIINITNRGPSIATGLVLTNKLSAPVQFLSSSSNAENCTNAADQLVCRLPDLAPGDSLTITNQFAPTLLGELYNYVLISSDEYDPNPADNVAVAANQIVPATGLSINDFSSIEGNQNHAEHFAVLLWPARNQTVTVDYDFTDGTAHAGQDYLGTPGTLTFPPGTTNGNLNVVIVGNLLSQPDRAFFANLRNPVNAPIARSRGTCTILDDDPPALSINDIAVNVGTNGSAVAVLTVSLSNLASSPVEVDYATVNGTANAGTDYEARSGTLTFPPGTNAMTIRIPIAGNTADEGQEEFYVQLSNPQNATLARDRGVVTITAEAPVDLSISNASVLEGNVGLTPATFTVSLRNPIQHTATVDFFTSDGTALAGSDYVSTNGTLVFAPGEVQKQITVEVIGDTIAEPNETFFVTLTNAFNGVIRNGRGVGTILDDDAPPCLSIGDATVLEGNSGTNNALLPLRLSGLSSFTVSVEVYLPNCRSSSESGSAPQIIAFYPGQLEQTIAVPIVGNTIHQPNDTCLVVLSNALNATICRGQGVLTVIDDDPLPGIEISDVSVLEGNSGTTPATFTVTLVGATSDTVTVNFATSDGTANAGSDYLATSGTLTFPPGLTSTNITVLVNGDVIVEPDETFFVTLSQPTNASLFKAKGTGTILNDDSPPQESCPSVIVLATPANQSCFQPSDAIILTANPDLAADQITQVEFYSGSSLLGIVNSSPFQIVWNGASVGDYCLTAKATCKSGRVITSDPFCIGITDNGTSIAIVRNFDDPEINKMRDYLLEMGYCARVFDQAGLTFDALSTFQAVIWDDLGADGLSDATVQVLQLVFSNNIPVYLIGDRLLGALNTLNPADRLVWTGLLHLSPLTQTAVPGPVTFSPDLQNREPGAILSGQFGLINDFVYTNSVVLAKATPDVTSLATGSGADLFVEFPDVNAPDNGQARSVSQTFRVVTGGDPGSLTNRKSLFQNTICWLLRCSYCSLVNLELAFPDVPASANLGDQFTYTLNVSNNGECAAAGTIVTNVLPMGLSLVSVSYNQGISADFNPVDRTLVWRVGSVASGTVNSANLAVTVRAVQPGSYRGMACGLANYETFDQSNCAEFDLDIVGGSTPSAPSLSLQQSAYGLYQLRLAGQQGANYQIQSSTDLVNWLAWTNAPGPLFYIELPLSSSSITSQPRFYRARWP
jgi:uncharacterized repeat protein (TIGR01451 family)